MTDRARTRSRWPAATYAHCNNIQIDGAVNNDLFGLAGSGTPGGQTEAQPVSIDAVQELQLVVSPYDVRQGGFSGGGVSAITRSGTNEFHGAGYYFFRSESMVTATAPAGRRPDRDLRRQAVPGLPAWAVPIVRDKVFFFANVDFGRKNRPSGFTVGRRLLGPVVRPARARAARCLSILQTRWLRPGGTSGSRRTFPTTRSWPSWTST